MLCANRRSDFVPRLTYASVEGMFLELVDASPVRRCVDTHSEILLVVWKCEEETWIDAACTAMLCDQHTCAEVVTEWWL